MAQDRTKQNWYFGDGPFGIQFTQPGDTAKLINRPITGISGFGNGGSAVASDPVSGGLLFYTDGVNVYDATHRMMPNGNDIGGAPAPSGNQPAVIVKAPDQTSKYYILTNNAAGLSAGQVRLTVVDSAAFGNSTFPNLPLGDVSTQPNEKAFPVPNLANQSDAMMVIPNSNGTDFWLITHEAGTGSFKVSTIDASGITAPATATDPGTGISFTAAHFAYDSVRNRLAVAPAEPGLNVMIFDFDPDNGNLSFDQTTGFVFNTATTSTAVPAIYDMEWSSNGQYLYVSRQGDAITPGTLLQYDLTDLTITAGTVNTQAIARSYGLQMAPDSSIYHIYQETAGGPFLVGRITDPDSVASNAAYEPLPFGAVDFNATQFPSFLQATPPSVTVDFDFSGTCATQPTTFFPEVIPGADSLVWDFGDGQSSTQWSPSHTYEQGGAFPVTLYAVTNGDTVGQVTKNVNITQFDLQLTLVQDTTACSCELRFPKSTTAPTTYPNGQACNPFTLTAEASGQANNIKWYGPAGEMTELQGSLTLTGIDSAGFYYVVAQDASGCFAYAGVNIKEYGVDDPRTNIWYFGNNAGINFNPDFRPATGADPIPGDLVTPEGAAVICDQNGQIVISTNGEAVFDRDGNPLVNVPPGFGGSTGSTQSSLIIPVAGDPTLYYIFTTQQTDPPTAYELRYALFDLKRISNGTTGEIIDPDGDPTNGVSTVLFTRSTERITGNENWLIAHEFGTNNFRAYRITPQGLSAPVISSAGSDHSVSSFQQGQGYMKLTASGLLAVALSGPDGNFVEVFNFDNATGVVSNPRRIDIGASGQVYGVDISPSGQKLFATTIGAGGALIEFRYDSLTETYINPTTLGSGSDFGAIERGPDGTTYVAVNGSGSLGTIAVNENPLLPSTFDAAGFPLQGPTSTLGLPNFIQNIGTPTQGPSISATGFCDGLPTEFTGSGTDPIDTLIWDFGDGTGQEGANLTSVQHTYDTAGTYIVTLTIRNRCIGHVGILKDTVTINANPVAMNGAAVICNINDAPLQAVAPGTDLTGLTFEWSTGETTPSIRPQQPGLYDIIVRTAANCLDTGQYTVVDNRLRVDLGADQTLCENTNPITINPQLPDAAQLAWRINGTQVSTAPTFTFNPTNASPPNYQLIVDVTDPFTTCVFSDTVVYTVNPEPAFTLLGNNPVPPCGSPTGSIDINITSTGNYFYTVSGPASTGPFAQTGPGTANVVGLRAGSYNVAVVDQVTGCFNGETAGLSDNAFTVALDRAQPCNDVNGQMPVIITLTGTPPPAPANFAFRILENNTTAEVLGGTAGSNPFTTTSGVDNGSYVAEVTAGGCLAVSPVVDIEQDDTVPINGLTIDQCSTPISLSVDAPQATGFAWTGPAIQNPNLATTSASPAAGIHQYFVRLTAPGFCPSDTTVTVNTDPVPAATITQSDPCTDQVTLSASPTGNFTYRWFRNATPIPGGQVVSVSIADNNATYQVDVRNNTNGCITSATEQIAVLGELTVDISNVAPCSGVDFTLTATTNQTPDSYQWALNNTPITSANTSDLLVTDDRKGMYRVIVQRSAAGSTCTAKDSVNIIINPTTPGLLTDTGIICPDHTDPRFNQVELYPGQGFISYQWFFEGAELSGETDSTLIATEVGVYSVDLVNVYNCASSDQIELLEECDPLITGPNAFRPSSNVNEGGEYVNREFYIYTFFIADEDFNVFIFNRWGEMVFSSNDRNFRWNGGYNNNPGQPLPPGTYSYVIKYKTSYKPRNQEKRGGVVLLR